MQIDVNGTVISRTSDFWNGTAREPTGHQDRFEREDTGTQ